MYVTRALSSYRRNPIELSAAAAGGPHSGLMVMRGEEADEEEGRGCLSSGCGYAQGLFPKITRPQNAVLHNTCSDSGDDCLFIPLLDQPLSSNRYHVIHANGIHKGLASRCSTEEGMSYCCSRRIIEDVEPTAFDYRDEYQQYEICSDSDAGFYAKPIVPYSFPPSFLRFKFHLFVKTSEVYHLDDAQGLDHSLRMSLPELDFTRIIIGKWYTPFVFVKGEGPVKVQMEKYLFYTITLEKRWQKIHSCENHGSKGNAIAVNISVQREVNFLFGTEAEKDSGMDNDGLIWFRVYDHRREVNKVGLSLAFVERMRWLEQSARWVDGVETASGVGWRRFCCYVLVESFVLRRMDGTLVLNCDFRHTNEIQTKWQ
ncbi:Uncharacterized protein TCM_033504 [Theobroma cacao]|uniref:Uncharacterized protein n=1 Tax=Theobroma cacao TaxID=3641 RepID=A0A061FBF7_THECC|nr:Uncharacterized protein TCM_033504 [Theobroma cacao]